MSNPRISVVMATHSCEKYLEAAIRSILQQSFQDFEFIIVDDGSVDSTPEILSRLAQFDPRIRIVGLSHCGLTSALIAGVKQSTGEFLARMDADDIAEPSRFEKQIRFMKNRPEVVCCGTWAILTEERGLPFGYWQLPTEHREISSRLEYRSGGIIHPSAMIRRSSYEVVGGYDPRWRFAQDYDLWLRLSEIGELANLPEHLIRFRRTHTTISQSKRAEQEDCARTIHQEAMTRRGIQRDFQTGNSIDLGSSSLDIAERALESDFSKTALIYSMRNMFTLRKRPPQELRRCYNVSTAAIVEILKSILPNRLRKILRGTKQILFRTNT